jgi:hypothetical protein
MSGPECRTSGGPVQHVGKLPDADDYQGGALRLKRLIQAALYRFSPKLRRHLLRMFGRSIADSVPPGNGATKDHMLCVFEAA